MASIVVEVVYALPGGADCVRLRLPAGATAIQAVQASGMLQRHRQLDGQRLKLGIYGRITASDTPLHDGDRVEIYRALPEDPREARRRRALRKR